MSVQLKLGPCLFIFSVRFFFKWISNIYEYEISVAFHFDVKNKFKPFLQMQNKMKMKWDVFKKSSFQSWNYIQFHALRYFIMQWNTDFMKWLYLFFGDILKKIQLKREEYLVSNINLHEQSNGFECKSAIWILNFSKWIISMH